MKQNTWQVLASAALETLEDRRMMSASPASVSLDHGALQMTADSNAPASMTVSYGANRSVLMAHSGNVWKTFPTSQVQTIVITGGDEADNVYVSPHVDIPARITVGNGNDMISGGNGNDTIVAGNGNDYIKVTRGDNAITVGSGNDFLKLTRNHDLVTAGTGADRIDANDGHATIENVTDRTTLEHGENVKIVKKAATASTAQASTAQSTPAQATTTATVAAAPASGSIVATPGDSSSGTTAPAAPPATGASTPTPSSSDNTSDNGITSLGAVTTSTGTTAPTAVITTLAGTRQTGLAINVDALSSTMGSGQDIDAQFVWNFGDAKGDHNTITGYTAAHVYDTPGTYTISLTVTNGAGVSATATEQVTITAAARNILYVDSQAGSDSNAGTINAPLQSYAAALAKVTDNTEVLFKAGEDFPVTQASTIVSSNVVLGKYGTGADPELDRASGNGLATLTLDQASSDVTVQNLTLNCPWAAVADDAQAPKVGNSGIYIGGTNNTVRDCTFLNLDDAMNENKNPTGVLIEDNQAPLITGVRGYFAWVQGSEETIIGNLVANSTREHCIRASGWTDVTVTDNTLTNLSRQNTGDTYDISKGCIELHEGSYGYVSYNNVTDGDIRTGPLGLWGENPSDATTNCVIEDNQLTNTFVNVIAGSEHVMIANNVILDNTNQAVVLGAPNGSFSSSDINIIHNTGINTGTQGNFLYLLGQVNGVKLDDNVWIAPNIKPGVYTTAAVRIVPDNLSSFTSISNNVWPTGKNGFGYALGGVMAISGAEDGYLTDAQWLAYSTVKGDVFEDVSLASTDTIYQLNVNGNMVGAAVKLAA